MTATRWWHTERLTLRFLNADDVAPLTAYRNDPRVAALQEWDLPYPEAKAHAQVAALAGLTDFEAGRGHQVAMLHDGELVGDVYVGLHEHGGIAEIGFSLIPSAQGRGLATEATGALIDDLVERVGVHRVTAELSPDNVASARLLERLGLSFEALAMKSFWWRGGWDDNLCYSMTADQWRAWRDRPRQAPEQVCLVDITAANRQEFARLGVHRSQERFVASVAEAYADALFPESVDGTGAVPVLYGVEADGEPSGFLMQTGSALSRLLVDRWQQGRGIGRRALGLWLDAMRLAGHTEVTTTWMAGQGGPGRFFEGAGFEPVETLVDGRMVARRRLAGSADRQDR